MLVERLERRVFGFLVKHIPDPQDAEDLLQDTFLQVYRSLPSFRGDSRLSTWVLGIALNVARNHRNRAAKHKYKWTGEEALVDLPAPRSDPHRQAEVHDFAEALQAAMGTLTDELREALVLVALEGHSYEEAAKIATVPVGTMKNRVFRARQALRQELDRHGHMAFLED